MPYPSETFIGQFASTLQMVADELRAYASQVTGWMAIEHKADGSHGAITGDSLALTGDLEVGGDAVIDGAISADAAAISLDTLNETTVTDGATGPGMRFGDAALYYYDGGADKFIKLSMDGDTPVQVRHTAGEYFLQPGPIGNAVEPVNLGSPLESGHDGWWNKVYAVEYYAQGRSVPEGEWTQVTFAAGNFTGNGAMTWTVISGNVLTMQWRIIDHSMLVNFYLISGTVGGTPNTELRIAIPGGFVANKTTRAICSIFNNGADALSVCNVTAAGTTINIFTTAAGSVNWTAGTVSVQGQIEFEIQ